MKIKEIHNVPCLKNSIRLQDYAVGIFKMNPTKSGVKKAIKKGLVYVDEKLATTALFLHGGECIRLFENEQQTKQFNLKLSVVFEDDYLAIIEKPAGINVSGNSFATIDNALAKNIKKSNQYDAVRPRPIHRLDYPTSGLLLIGKTTTSIIALNKLFETKKIQKKYYAITIGKMPVKGSIDSNIDTKEALTNYKVVQSVISKRFQFLNLVELQPLTGRKHQLRKHVTSIGNPILGDKEYYIEDLILNGNGLYLHATSLSFIHPITNTTLKISSELPKKFKRIFKINSIN